MTYMFEVYYRPPRDLACEKRITDQVVALGGRLDFWENSTEFTGICLTFKFDDVTQAETAAEAIRAQGELVTVGPRPYGD